MSKTHWKKLQNPDYIGAYELEDGKDLNVIIDSVRTEQVKNVQGQSEECCVARLKGHKPMILNVTNSKMIARLTGSPYIEDWSDTEMTLYVAMVPAFGETVEALRIRPKTAKREKEVLTLGHKRWDGAVKAVKSGSYQLSDITDKYKLTDDVLDIFKKAAGIDDEI